MAVNVVYPDGEGADEVVRRQLERHPLRDLRPVLTPDEVVAAQRAVRAVYVDDAVVRYAVALAEATRADPGIELGASPRASLWLVRCAQARAIANARDYALPDDVKALAVPALAHRLVPKRARVSGDVAATVVRRLLDEVPVPLHAARAG
jgi:MoxR-like ATPase